MSHNEDAEPKKTHLSEEVSGGGEKSDGENMSQEVIEQNTEKEEDQGRNAEMPDENAQVNETSDEVSSQEEEKADSVAADNGEADAGEDAKRKKSVSSPKSAKGPLDEVLQKIESESNPDEKLKMAISHMECFLAQGTMPQFKEFWELRKLCLDYFKQNVSPAVRSALWPKYSELSKEARRLKEIFDERSAFAVEQIEKAVAALEEDLESCEEKIGAQPDVDFQFESAFFASRESVYNDLQKRLNFFNAYATRINNLRKELIKVDIRIKQKNKFFQRLSSAGDKVFPKRKELIKTVSDQFVADVDSFIARNFEKGHAKTSLFTLREEIKALQGIAKVLTLNTHSFTTTRMKLSECWDSLKVLDKERKKVRAEKKEVFEKNKQEVLDKIKAFNEEFSQGNLSVGASNKTLDEIQSFMRNVELGRDEVKALREELGKSTALVKEKMAEEEKARLEEEKEKIRAKREKVDAIKSKISDLIASAPEMTADAIDGSLKDINKEISGNKDLTPRERSDIEKPLRSLKDVINEKREQELLNLSDDDQETLANLRKILKQRRERRKEIKQQYDDLRKLSGSYGMDLEKAMMHNEQVQQEKDRLDAADQGIAEIEEKISEIKKKI